MDFCSLLSPPCNLLEFTRGLYVPYKIFTAVKYYIYNQFTLEVKLTPLFPDPSCLPYPLWGGRWVTDNSWVVNLVDRLLAGLLLADLLADVLLLAWVLVLLLLGAHQAALGARRSDTMYFLEPSLADIMASDTVATVIMAIVIMAIVIT